MIIFLFVPLLPFSSLLGGKSCSNMERSTGPRSALYVRPELFTCWNYTNCMGWKYISELFTCWNYTNCMGWKYTSELFTCWNFTNCMRWIYTFLARKIHIVCAGNKKSFLESKICKFILCYDVFNKRT